jgi:hypothetical protein
MTEVKQFGRANKKTNRPKLIATINLIPINYKTYKKISKLSYLQLQSALNYSHNTPNRHHHN